MNRRLFYWFLLGAAGFSVFFFLRTSVDFNAGAALIESRQTVEQKTGKLAERLGFSLDTLSLHTVRNQHVGYYRILKDSLGAQLPTPYELNRQGIPLTAWSVIIGTPMKEDKAVVLNEKDLFDKAGNLEIKYDNDGSVRRISSNSDAYNPTFVAGDSLTAIANHIMKDILGYELDNYSLEDVDVENNLSPGGEAVSQTSAANPAELSSDRGTRFRFNWVHRNSKEAGPKEFSLVLQPMIKEVGDGLNTVIKYGASIVDFKALNRYEPAIHSNRLFSGNAAYVVSFGSIVLLVILVFFAGIRHINRGQVEWRRALIVFTAVMLGMVGWRSIYLMSHLDDFFNDTGTLIYMLNTLITGGMCGLYAALAYIGWEAMSRSEDREDIHLVDAFWRKRFFFHETGESLIRGYVLGGVMLGVLALLLKVMNLVYYQADSQFGYAEASMSPRLLTINMSAWINVILVALGHVGVTVGLLNQYLNNKKQWLYYLAGAVVLGFLIAGSATLIATEGTIWSEILIFVILSLFILYAVQHWGVLSFSTAWWVFVLLLMTTPFLGSADTGLSYVAWGQGLILAVPLIYGFVAYRYGGPIAEMAGYIPEYQERIANHLRVEKEIEIARESQFKLMPLKPPALNGIDVYGFFMPSFEVGGDYFDYVVSKNGSSEPESLTMTIADVSGKAMKAAMHAVFTSGLLLSRLHRDTPEAILREVAPTLHLRTDPQTFITCIIARYHLKSRQLTIASAGHCHPIIKSEGTSSFIKTPPPRYPLGIRSEVDYSSLEMNLTPGDFLLLYSDGLPEAVDPQGNRFGFDYLLEMVDELDTDSLTTNEIALEIKRRVQKFSDYQLADDTTIICLKV